MSIFDRIRRITKSNLNWLMDMAEPAEQELQARIRELEETLMEGRESAAAYGATCRRLANELSQLKARVAECQQRAEAAMKAGDEKTARAVLQQKVQLSERIAQMTPGAEKAQHTFEKLRDNLVALQQQLKDAKLKLQDLRTRLKIADAQKQFDAHLQKSVSTHPDGLAFERLEDQVAQREAEVEVGAELQAGAMSDYELDRQSRDLQVEAEMQALKDKLDGR